MSRPSFGRKPPANMGVKTAGVALATNSNMNNSLQNSAHQRHSMDESSYPLRSYHYHAQQREEVLNPEYYASSNSKKEATIVLPSIAADSICEPHIRQSTLGHSHGGHSAANNGGHYSSTDSVIKRPPPILKDYFDCFVNEHFGTDYYYSNIVSKLLTLTPFGGSQTSYYTELLNPFHYNELIPSSQLTSIASRAGVPPELQVFRGGKSSSATTIASAEGGRDAGQTPHSKQKNSNKKIKQEESHVADCASVAADRWTLRPNLVTVRAAPRRPLSRPIRRGAKVTVKVNGVEVEITGASSGQKREREDLLVLLGGNNEERKNRRPKHDDDDDENLDNISEEEYGSDFMSQDDDDDDFNMDNKSGDEATDYNYS